MKKIFLLSLLFASTFCFAQQGNAPYPIINAESYSGVNPRYYISGVQGSVTGAGLNYAFVNPTFSSTNGKDTIKMFPSAWQTMVIPTDSLGGNTVTGDTAVLVLVKSSYGSYTGDNMRFQIQAGNVGGTETSYRAHVTFRNLSKFPFLWTTPSDSVTTLTSKQCLFIEFQSVDGQVWLEKSRIVETPLK